MKRIAKLLLAAVAFNAVLLFVLSRDTLYSCFSVTTEAVVFAIGGLTGIFISIMIIFNMFFFRPLRSCFMRLEADEN